MMQPLDELEREENALPPNWTRCTIGEITLPVQKIDPRRQADRDIAYIDISSIDNKSNRVAEAKSLRLSEAPDRARQVVRQGDVLFSLVRPYLRNIASVRAEFDGQVASTGFSVLRPAAGIEPSFLFLRAISQEFVDALSGVQYGVSYPAVKDDQVRAQKIKLPPSEEQRRIVDRIDMLFAQLDKGEEALRAVQKQLARYRQSVLRAAVTGQLTADWRAENAHRLEHGRDLLARILQARREAWDGRGKYKEPIEPDSADVPELPEGWAWASVDQIIREGLSNGRSVPDAAEGFPVLRLTSLRDGRIDLTERKTGAWSAASAQAFLVERGDVLVSRGNGSKQLVGRGGLVDEEPDPVAYPDTMIRIPILREHIHPEWFLQLWNASFMREQIEKSAKTTAGIYKINQTDIRNFIVPVPSLSEQLAIEEIVDEQMEKIGQLAAWCEAELARSAALRQSILKDAFAGRLVSQEPDDEPAADLLARIRGRSSAAPRRTRRITA